VNLQPAPHRARAVRGIVVATLILATAATAHAHWLSPEEIINGLANNPRVHDTVGVTEVYRDKHLPRLLIIKVRRAQWETLPAPSRLKLAEEWFGTWRHNVPQGIVAILDAATDHSLIAYDGTGHATLKDPPTAAPAAAATPTP